MSGLFRDTGHGAERLAARSHVPRHRHLEAYAAIVLAGGYVEAGDGGRWRVSAGDVVIHDRMEAHQDHIGPGGCALVNLPITGAPPAPGVFRTADLDDIARLARRDPRAAAASLLSRPLSPVAPLGDWPDLLARRLADAPAVSLGAWAEAVGLAPESVSRGFALAYGVAPSRYRLELRARRAWFMIRAGGQGLAAIAQDCGFADQAHLTRTLSRLTGRSPGRWRAEVKSVQ
jgi:AraC-like DNA-binding protein